MKPAVVEQLHLDHEGRARPVPAADIQDRQLGALDERELLARQVLQPDDGLFAGALEQVVEQAAEDVRWVPKMRRNTKSFFRSAKTMPPFCRNGGRRARHDGLTPVEHIVPVGRRACGPCRSRSARVAPRLLLRRLVLALRLAPVAVLVA